MLTFVHMDLFTPGNNPETYSLSDFARKVEEAIAGTFNQSYWIRAEMARLNHYPESGHCYPDLVEREDNQLRAQMRGMIWARDYERIAGQFRQVAHEEPGDGMQVLVRASLRFHALYGLSLQIHEIDPAYTLGQLAREKMETIRRLKDEGIFDRNREMEMALLPKKLAVISVQTSKGLSDFIRILEQNPHHYSFIYTLFPALLQGDAAVGSILAQLRAIRSHSGLFDAVAIIRGGGGEVGLSCYDNYSLARAVALFPLPVLTGIGHSTNETVVEMVAQMSKITPTDVAYFLLERFKEFDARVKAASEHLQASVESKLAEEDASLDYLSRGFRALAQQALFIETGRLLNASREMHREAMSSIDKERSILESRSAMLRLNGRHLLRIHGSGLEMMEKKVRLLDPANTLKRGYSITFANGELLTDADRVVAGDEITTRLHLGNLKSTVKSKEKQ